MTEDQVSRYINLVARRTYILTHSGIVWRPGAGKDRQGAERITSPGGGRAQRKGPPAATG